jgi:prepilin-type N-terminal cleavage/methylation domain-containing protein
MLYMEEEAMNTRRNRKGFTLMEMLVVIVIIGIITGLLFRLHSTATERAARAATLQRLENIKLCLEEYYRLHGEYPPGGYGTEFQGYYFGDAEYFFPDDWEKIRNYIEQNEIDFMTPGVTGLLYYICAHPEVNYTRSESERWREYWDGGVGWWDGTLTWAELGELGLPDVGTGEVTNRIFRLLDGWRNQFVYNCSDPYQSYELYSGGATGSSEDDIGRGGMVE